MTRSLAMRVARHGRRTHHILTCLRRAVLLVQSWEHRGNDDLQVTERVVSPSWLTRNEPSPPLVASRWPFATLAPPAPDRTKIPSTRQLVTRANNPRF